MDKILCDMINNNQSYRVIETEDSMIVKIRPNAVALPLTGKLRVEDINVGRQSLERELRLNNIRTDLYRQCTGCSYSNQSAFRAIPRGQESAVIMVLNDKPTEYETYAMMSSCDSSGLFLNCVIDKLVSVSKGKTSIIRKNNFYFTDIVKCSNVNDKQGCCNCAQRYLKNEIAYVNPMIIICNGINTLYNSVNYGIIKNLPSQVQHGIIYDVNTSDGNSMKIVAIEDISSILQYNGQQLLDAKKRLWEQLYHILTTLERSIDNECQQNQN